GASVHADEASRAPEPWRIRVDGDAARVPRATGAIAPFALLQHAARGIGSLNILLDGDGVVRRLPLLFRADDGYYPSLALAVACGYLGVTPDRITLRPGQSIVLAGGRGGSGPASDIAIPVDRTGAMRLNFTGGWLAFDHYAFGDLWRDATMD